VYGHPCPSSSSTATAQVQDRNPASMRIGMTSLRHSSTVTEYTRSPSGVQQIL
jgi:hypothetical protein